MTAAQVKRLKAKFDKIRTLSEEAADIFGDDPMEGELFTAINNITAACDWGVEALNEKEVK